MIYTGLYWLFVLSSKEGKKSKAFRSGLLAMMYPGYVNVDNKINQIRQEKNIFIYDLLMG